MGQEITDTHFEAGDFTHFAEQLKLETKQLLKRFHQADFINQGEVGGFEMEAWIMDQAYQPLGINQVFLEQLNNPLAVPELASFNVELNGTPQTLTGNALSNMATELQLLWQQCQHTAVDLGAQLVMMGILPTVTKNLLNLDNMSPLKRYRALNEQLLRLRLERPLKFCIQGKTQVFNDAHDDVMMESAATSFQLHIQVALSEAVRFYNAAKIISAPMVAISANSPYLFGLDLWDETRIPLFEQAVAVDYPQRVTFGDSYATRSLAECFLINHQYYPVLLPMRLPQTGQDYPYVQLHNGTIWRWNRPLIGVNHEGQMHLRVEHRVIPAGPSIDDSIANAALFFGIIHQLARQINPPEHQLPFSQARRNFYLAAKHGLQAKIRWLDGREINISELLQQHLLPLAKQGLITLGLATDDIDYYLGIIEGRLRTGRNGAAWQRAYTKRHGLNMQALTAAYVENQNNRLPVHEWNI